MRVTFLIRKRQQPGTALQNAAAMDAGHLKSIGHTVQVLAIPEGDTLPIFDIYEQDLVIIESAGWVGVDQIKMLVRRGSVVIVRVHAAPEFLYYEFPGISTTAYLREARAAGATAAFVSYELAARFGGLHLPVAYPMPKSTPIISPAQGNIHVGCFGAIRPLKNHMGELIAIARAKAVWFKQREFYMHINSTRVEGSDRILPELKEAALEFRVHLVSHTWLGAEDFQKVIRTMTVGLFGSYAESFCLTAADFVSAGVPAVLSSHIYWGQGVPTDVGSLAANLLSVLSEPNGNIHGNYKGLRDYCVGAVGRWAACLNNVRDLCHC